METCQNKDSAAEIFVQQYVHNTTKIMKTYFLKKCTHNISNIFYF